MKTRQYIVLILLLSTTLAFTMVQVKAHSRPFLSAWTSIAPTIDGVVDTASEWAIADKQLFTLGDDYSGAIYVMNDDNNLYLAVRVTDDDFGTTATTYDAVQFYFDNDHDGAGPEEGDDSLICSDYLLGFDSFYNLSSGWTWDSLYGGTEDGAVAATGDGFVNSFEFTHPLDSLDLVHDFSLKPGMIVGFTLGYIDNRTHVGTWPASSFNPPSSWHDILIASPNSIYQGNLILRRNTVFIIEDRRFDINGSIYVTENATLIVRNAIINFTEEDDYSELSFSDPVNGRPRLIAENVTLTSPYGVLVEFYHNSSAIIDQLECAPLFPSGFPCGGIEAAGSQVQLVMSNSGPLGWFAAYDSEFEVWNSIVNGTFALRNAVGHVTDSEVGWCPVEEDSELIATNCTFKYGFYSAGSSNITVYDSRLHEDPDYSAVTARDSSSITFSGNVEVNGSLLLHENSTLHLKDAYLDLMQIHDEEYNITLTDRSSLEVTNATVMSSYVFIIHFYNNSTAIADMLVTPVTLARVYAFDSTILELNRFSSRYLRTFNSSIVNLSNSSPYYLRSYGDSAFNIFNSTIRRQYSLNSSTVTASSSNIILDFRCFDTSQLQATDSTMDELYAYNGSTCVLVNSTYISRQVLDQSEVHVWWYLDVQVEDSIGQDVPTANVTVNYPNATLVDWKLTDVNGLTSFTLMEKMINVTGEYPVGDYTAGGSYETYSNETAVEMTGNQQITIVLEFVIPEFSSLTIISLLAIVTAIAVIFRKQNNP